MFGYVEHWECKHRTKFFSSKINYAKRFLIHFSCIKYYGDHVKRRHLHNVFYFSKFSIIYTYNRNIFLNITIILIFELIIVQQC